MATFENLRSYGLAGGEADARAAGGDDSYLAWDLEGPA